MPRFFIAGTNLAGGMAVLRGRDAEHLRVLRLRPGEDLILCDGRGTDYKCRLVYADKEQAEAEVLEVVHCPAEPDVARTGSIISASGTPLSDGSTFSNLAMRFILFIMNTAAISDIVNSSSLCQRFHHRAVNAVAEHKMLAKRYAVGIERIGKTDGGVYIRLRRERGALDVIVRKINVRGAAQNGGFGDIAYAEPHGIYVADEYHPVEQHSVVFAQAEQADLLFFCVAEIFAKHRGGFLGRMYEPVFDAAFLFHGVAAEKRYEDRGVFADEPRARKLADACRKHGGKRAEPVYQLIRQRADVAPRERVAQKQFERAVRSERACAAVFVYAAKSFAVAFVRSRVGYPQAYLFSS